MDNLKLKVTLPIAENQKAINEFLLVEANTTNKSSKTLFSYRKKLQTIFQDITVPYNLLQPDDINKWLMTKKHLKDSTIQKYESVMRVFYRFCIKEGYLEKSPIEIKPRENKPSENGGKITQNYWELRRELPNADNQRVVNEFLFTMKNLNRKVNTIVVYRGCLSYFFKDWEKAFTSITLDEIRQWFNEEQKKKTESNIDDRYIKPLRSFYSFCEEVGYIVEPPIEKKSWNRTPERYWEIQRPLRNRKNKVIINEFLFNLKNINKTKRTIENYRVILQFFFKERKELFSSITSIDIDHWMNDQIKNKSKDTVGRNLSVIRTFYRFCIKQGYMEKSPVKYPWERDGSNRKYWELKSQLLNDKNHQVINEYLLSIKLANLSERTIQDRRFYLERFFKNEKESYDNLKSEYIQKWFIERKEMLQETTISSYLSMLSAFYLFCVEEGYVEKSPIKSRWFPRLPKPMPKYLEKEQIAKIRMQSEEHPLRDLLIVEFLYASGCRIGELNTLNRTDVDIENRTALVLGKGKKFRKIHFTVKCAILLERYLETRDDNHPALFLSERETRLGIQRIRDILKNIGKRVNLVGSLHAHRFRHTFATELLAKGADLSFIADELGHRNLQTTQIYARLPKRELILMYRKYMR
ncbi:tyrosine-type recombinase/integrase [Ureibacillus chungkukjangi]|uniref:Site-specific recombinase XerD n=1 Tax=Ureibacillus chungkukjangi TaxID=1202712 RepID=A0A318U6J6_9BACL|nr:tyrosine-type recombinase/integrase [Ureibacillus chungkukjangi]PYF07569.1 site-specific recombinase XerD [Ureibacillus chungkukjangi]